jgi:hypothetical protein
MLEIQLDSMTRASISAYSSTVFSCFGGEFNVIFTSVFTTWLFSLRVINSFSLLSIVANIFVVLVLARSFYSALTSASTSASASTATSMIGASILEAL